MTPYDMAETILVAGGFLIKKMSGNKIAVLTNENRMKIIESIKEMFKGSRYDPTPKSDSSMGRVIIGSLSIIVKPASKQGRASAGVDNEDMVVDYINTSCKTGKMNIVFAGANRVTFEVIGCVSAKTVGADTAGRKKADIVLTDYKGKTYPISIKKDNAETWESADKYFASEADKIISKAVADGITEIVSNGTYFTIEPNIAVKATVQETRDVVFGSDIEGKGCIVTETFKTSSFVSSGDTITINCSHVINKMQDVKGDKEVYFLLRNDKTRKSLKKYPGIRALAVYKKRINKNVKVVQR